MGASRLDLSMDFGRYLRTKFPYLYVALYSLAYLSGLTTGLHSSSIVSCAWSFGILTVTMILGSSIAIWFRWRRYVTWANAEADEFIRRMEQDAH